MSLMSISGTLGSGVQDIAKSLAEGLKLDLYDDQRLHEEAVKTGIRSDELKSLEEKAPSFFDHLWSHKPELYLDLMESVVYGVARRGEGIIMGHGSPLLLREFGCALHVLVHAPHPSRVRNLVDRHGLSEKAAEKLIEKNDHERQGFLRFAFQMDWNDLNLYDLVINTEKLGFSGAVQLIMEASNQQAIKECSLKALEAMENLFLTKKVQAELLRQDFNLSRLHVEVPEQGQVRIWGIADTAERKERIVEIINVVQGVKEVKAELVVIPSSAV